VKIRSVPAILNHSKGQPIAANIPLSKAVAFAAGLGLSMLSYPVHAAATSSGVHGHDHATAWSATLPI
jgi:hypothetical protein